VRVAVLLCLPMLMVPVRSRPRANSVVVGCFDVPWAARTFNHVPRLRAGTRPDW
jgi:hypothetical protein